MAKQSFFIKVFMGVLAVHSTVAVSAAPRSPRRALKSPRTLNLGGAFITLEHIKNWHRLGPQDPINVGEGRTLYTEGVNLTQVKNELKLNTVFASPVIVAIIDSGANMHHERLKSYVYVNPKEKNGRPGVDDDKNGYIDDVSGWDFLGPSTYYDTLEVTRLHARCEDNQSAISDSKPVDCKAIEEEFHAKKSACEEDTAFYEGYLARIRAIDATYGLGVEPSGNALTLPLREDLRKSMYDRLLDKINQLPNEDTYEIYTRQEPRLKPFLPEKTTDKSILRFAMNRLLMYDHFFWIRGAQENPKMCAAQFSTENLAKNTPGYDANTPSHPYGVDIRGSYGIRPSHATHVGGILVDMLEFPLGRKTAPKAVSLLNIRAVPEGDERDQDVANAIRYAVDMGASVISMSFDKDYSQEQPLVQSAYDYAGDKGVLIVQEAGNDSRELTATNAFPSSYHRGERRRMDHVLVVGASNFVKAPLDQEWVPPSDRRLTLQPYYSQLMPYFTSYSKEFVDVFAPGSFIYSSYSENLEDTQSYEFLQGTSMATPGVAGIAALVMSQFPSLRFKASELKHILVESVRGYNAAASTLDGTTYIQFSDASVSGGVVDAYKALCRASERSKSKGGRSLRGC